MTCSRKMMVPECGTVEYHRQVERIKNEILAVNSQDEINYVVTAYIIDRSYSRAAICQAEKEAKKERHVP